MSFLSLFDIILKEQLGLTLWYSRQCGPLEYQHLLQVPICILTDAAPCSWAPEGGVEVCGPLPSQQRPERSSRLLASA